MEGKLGQSLTALFKYEKLILSEEETTSAGGCGVSLAAFWRPASACPSDSASQGIFYRLKRGIHSVRALPKHSNMEKI